MVNNIRIPIKIYIEVDKEKGWGLIILYPLSQTLVSQTSKRIASYEDIEFSLISILKKKIQNSIKGIEINFVSEEFDIDKEKLEQSLMHQLQIQWNDIEQKEKKQHKQFEIISNKIDYINKAA